MLAYHFACPGIGNVTKQGDGFRDLRWGFRFVR